MDDLSLHILDCAQNSVRAGATSIVIRIEEDPDKNVLVIDIEDNGSGMNTESSAKALDPFYTTKPNKRIGMGIPLLAQAAQEAGGAITVSSKPGQGTAIHVSFKYDNIDRKPLGNMADTIIALIAHDCAAFDIKYTHIYCGNNFEFDTHNIKAVLQDVPINDPAVLMDLKDQIECALQALRVP